MSESPDAPTTLPEFVRQFPTNQACAAYLFRLRYPDGYACPECGSTKAWAVDDLHQMICDQGHRVTVTAGTIMHRTKQPLTTWFYAAYLVSTLTPGISAVQFQKQLGINNYRTAFHLLHKLRAGLVDPDREPLKGEIEVDEAYVGGVEEGRPGRGAQDKALVVCAVEVIRYEALGKDRKTMVEKIRAGRCRLTVIEHADAATLVPWVQKNCEPGALIMTDGSASYNPLAKLGYDVMKIFASHKGVKTGEYLPLVHLIISNLKRWLLGTHKGAVRKHHLQAYLNEFTFRFNRRFWRGPAFIRILTRAVEAEDWPEYETLHDTKHKTEGAWVHPNPRPTVDKPTIRAIVEAVYEDASPATKRWILDHGDEVIAMVREAAEAAIRRGVSIEERLEEREGAARN